jgi:hypothetical protein
VTRLRNIDLVLLATQVVVVGILAEVRLLADDARLLKGGLRGRSGSCGFVRKDLVSEDFGREGRERCDATFEVISAGRESVYGHEKSPIMYTYCQSVCM